MKKNIEYLSRYLTTNMEPAHERLPTPSCVKPPPTSPPTVADTGLASNVDAEEELKALSETRPAWAVLLVATGILMSLFLVALDRTIVSTVRIR